MMSDRTTPGQRTPERDFVGIFKVAAYGNTVSDSCHLHTERGSELCNVHSGCLTLHSGICREDKLTDIASGTKPCEKLFYRKFVGSYAAHRRNSTVKYMINSVVLPCFFNGYNSTRVFDDTNC